jgi:DNA-binding response OmpR family regulator
VTDVGGKTDAQGDENTPGANPPNGAGGGERLVLIVDDDEYILDFLGIALEDEGYKVVTARHGAAALDVVRDHVPKVIILDLWMPVMDGFQFLREYRTQPAPHAAVIALTAAHYDASRGTEIEAEAFLTKPFSLDTLIRVVDSLSGRA